MKKKLIKTNEDVSVRTLYVGWIASMLIFYISIFYLRRSILDTTMFTFSILIVTVILGMIFFISLLKKLSKSKKNNRYKHYGKNILVVFTLFFVILYNYEIVEASLGFSPLQIQNSVIKNTTTPTPKPTFIPTPTPIPKATVKPQKTTITAKSNTTKSNPDTPVHCPINERCGGGTIPLKASECAQSICCGMSSGKWEFMKDGSKCSGGSNNVNQQNSVYKESNDNYTPPTYYSCTLYYRYSTETLSTTYNSGFKSKEDCEARQIELDQEYEANYSNTQQDSSALLSECLNTATTTYSRSVQSANVEYGGGSGVGDLMRELAQEQYDKDQAYCNTTYSN